MPELCAIHQGLTRRDCVVLFTTLACRRTIRFKKDGNGMLLGNMNMAFDPLMSSFLKWLS